MVGYQTYQQALEEEKKETDQAVTEQEQPQEKEQSEANQTIIDLQKEAESKPEPPQEIQITESNPEKIQKMKTGMPSFFDCTGNAGCFTEHVTRIVDGDTIYTGNYKIRLSLTNTPELNQTGYL
ncbi:MAG TPA: hypothetical protein VLD38_06845, partial [Nitrosopumilaceae archaeon]|nr:hypothetical protein [Nitrosopumilaceae archaeon]